MEKIIRFLEDLDAATATHGPKWAESMGRYYIKRGGILLGNVPPGGSIYVEGYRKRLDAAADRVTANCALTTDVPQE